MSNRMLVAIRSGFVDIPGRGLVEIVAGKDRIAPEYLRQNPALADFYEEDFSVPAFGGSRGIECRTTLPGGRVVAR